MAVCVGNQTEVMQVWQPTEGMECKKTRAAEEGYFAVFLHMVAISISYHRAAFLPTVTI